MMEDIMLSTVSITTPILLAALGGMFSNLVNELNIGLEGLMTISAFFSVLVASSSGNLFLGIICGMGVSIVFSLIMILFRLKLKGNIFILGLATNLLASGLVSFLGIKLLGSKGTVVFKNVSKMAVVFIENNSENAFSRILSGFNIFDYISFISVIISFFILYKTSHGFHMRATGLSKKTAINVGINVNKNKIVAYLLCGVLCGLSGASLSISVSSFTAGITNGRGWIALVAVILGRNNPIGILLASLLFGLTTAISSVLQTGTEISPKLLMMIPFIVTLIGLIFSSLNKGKKTEGI